MTFEVFLKLKIFLLRTWASHLIFLDLFFIDSWYFQALEFYDSTNLANIVYKWINFLITRRFSFLRFLH